MQLFFVAVDKKCFQPVNYNHTNGYKSFSLKLCGFISSEFTRVCFLTGCWLRIICSAALKGALTKNGVHLEWHTRIMYTENMNQSFRVISHIPHISDILLRKGFFTVTCFPDLRC